MKYYFRNHKRQGMGSI